MDSLQIYICNENKIPNLFFLRFLKEFLDLHPEIRDNRYPAKYLNFLLKNIYKCKILVADDGKVILRFNKRIDKTHFLLKFNSLY